jgi:hypothetical protein
MTITNLLRSGIHPWDRFKSWFTSTLMRETTETVSQNQGHAFGTCNVGRSWKPVIRITPRLEQAHRPG